MLAENKVILNCLVGSRSHGLESENSDYDYRGVFISKTSEILSIYPPSSSTSFINHKIDDTSHELHKFLGLALKCNPSILELFHARAENITDEGVRLQALFPKIWSSYYVYQSFRGYGRSQRKKFMEHQIGPKNGNPYKFAMTNIRVLLLGIELLCRGTMTLNVSVQQQYLGHILDPMDKFSNHETILRNIKAGKYPLALIFETIDHLGSALEKCYKMNPNKEPDLVVVNDFLLEIRKANW